MDRRTDHVEDPRKRLNSRLFLLRTIHCVILVACGFAIHVSPQQVEAGPLLARLDDVAALKEKAEAGDAQAQVTFGSILAAHQRQSEALDWYRKAAAHGNIDAECRMGEMLLYGASGESTNSVPANQGEGLHWTFMAATNLHSSACNNMANAFKQGLGTNPDPVAAYAWLIILSETPDGASLGRFGMNDMALKLNTEDIRRGHSLATEWKAGHWQAPVMQAIPKDDLSLNLSGVLLGTKHSLALINGRTMEQGESTRIKLKSGTFIVKCLQIQKDSVSIAVQGEDQPRILFISR